MNFVEILSNMHVSLCCGANPPFTHICEFDKNKIDSEIMNKISNEETLKEFSIEYLELFKKKYPSIPYGSVHYNNVPWVIFVYNSILKKMNDAPDDVTITYPNGCCPKKDCPINLFYDLVHAKIFSK